MAVTRRNFLIGVGAGLILPSVADRIGIILFRTHLYFKPRSSSVALSSMGTLLCLSPPAFATNAYPKKIEVCYNTVMLKNIIILAIPLALAGCKSSGLAWDIVNGILCC